MASAERKRAEQAEENALNFHIEEAAVIARKGGFIDNQLADIDLLSDKNKWDPLYGTLESGLPVVCEFNEKGTYFAIGYEKGAVDIFACASKTILLRSMNDPILYDDVGPLWRCVSLSWTPDSRHVIAAYQIDAKARTRLAADADQGLVICWETERGAEPFVSKFSSPISHINVCPSFQSRDLLCLVSCVTGEVWCLTYTYGEDSSGKIKLSESSKHVLYNPEQDALAEASQEPQEQTEEGSEKGEKSTPSVLRDGRAVWRHDGVVAYLLSCGRLIAIEVASGSVIARGDGPFDLWPSTLQLSEDGKELLCGSGRGLFLVPTESLCRDEGEVFGKRSGTGVLRRNKNVPCVMGDVGWGKDGCSVICASNSTAQIDNRLHVWHWLSGELAEMDTIDSPGVKGITYIALCPTRPLLVVLTPDEGAFSREQKAESSFPGPMYPAGYRVVTDNFPFEEAEDEFDIVVTRSPGGSITHVPAHEVVVSAQHEVKHDPPQFVDVVRSQSDVDVIGNVVDGVEHRPPVTIAADYVTTKLCMSPTKHGTTAATSRKSVPVNVNGGSSSGGGLEGGRRGDSNGGALLKRLLPPADLKVGSSKKRRTITDTNKERDAARLAKMEEYKKFCQGQYAEENRKVPARAGGKRSREPSMNEGDRGGQYQRIPSPHPSIPLRADDHSPISRESWGCTTPSVASSTDEVNDLHHGLAVEGGGWREASIDTTPPGDIDRGMVEVEQHTYSAPLLHNHSQGTTYPPVARNDYQAGFDDRAVRENGQPPTVYGGVPSYIKAPIPQSLLAPATTTLQQNGTYANGHYPLR